MLEYENEMFLSAMQEDGLTIAAKGLAMEKVAVVAQEGFSVPRWVRTLARVGVLLLRRRRWA